ncbi:MAG: hypothetical protein GC160_04215 [Acidobacteria bacterium]|nr:hypothetical protein [Acidobacteriota bacterium]
MPAICLMMVLAAPGLQAQLPVEAAEAELAIPFGAASGQIATADDLLLFLNSERMDASFAIRRENIRNMSVNNNVLTVETVEAVNGSNALNFRLLSGDASRFSRWAQGIAPATMTSGPAAAATSASAAVAPKASSVEMTYQARHNHRIGSGCTGRLLITDDRISYDSVDNIDHSRQWQLKEIKELKRKNPYKVIIDPFVGDKYELELIGGGMSSQDFQKIGSMISDSRKP